MSSQFPIPLNALRAIEIVARTRALGPAAEELGVTPGAVSQHLRRAEERLGVQLFERTPSGLIPGPELLAIQPLLRAGFQSLLEATHALRAAEDNVLTLTVGSVFASRWLVWRLPRFSALAPELEMRLVTTGKLVDLARPEIDCGIRFGGGNWPGVRAELIGGRSAIAVCAPQLAERLRTPMDLAHVPVIHDTPSMLSWADWFRGQGIDTPPDLKGPTYTDPALAFDAAAAGQGVLLTVDMMAADGLAMGRLVAPFSHRQPIGNGYWFVTDAARRLPKKVRLFLDWMRGEIAANAQWCLSGETTPEG